MKYLRMFEAASGLFPKRIKVTLIDAATGASLGKHKIPAKLLPVSFNRPIILEIDNVNWHVLHADPILADDFLFTKKLTLQVQHAANVDARLLKFSVPTICNDLPTIGTADLNHDFTLEIGKTDWRQIEFVSLKQSGVIEESSKIIEDIIAEQPNPLLGYERQHIRDNSVQPGLAIPFEKFCKRLVNPVRGNIFFNNSGFVQNGFALRSDSYNYYGILENGYIQTCCLTQFNWVDDEFMRVLSKYELCLVDWCNASRISAEIGETPKIEFVNI